MHLSSSAGKTGRSGGVGCEKPDGRCPGPVAAAPLGDVPMIAHYYLMMAGAWPGTAGMAE